jgi:hypothetical protein
MDTVMRNILINVLSDFIFVVFVAVLASIAYWSVRVVALDPASRFFGFAIREPGKIYVSGFEHSGLRTRKAVNALEYESASSLRDSLRPSYLASLPFRLVGFLARVIGQDLPLPDWNIEVAPLNSVHQAPDARSIIVIGGPVANQLTAFFLSDTPYFRFNDNTRRYEEWHEGKYRPIDPSQDVAVIEKRILGETTVILAHGYDEEQTLRAVEYLKHNWRRLYKKFGKSEFAIRID